MKFFSTKYTAAAFNFGLLVLRVFAGINMMFNHGLGKVQKVMSGAEIQFADPFGIGQRPSMYLAGFAEFVCSILLILGLFTRLALIPLIATMLVAIFSVHLHSSFDEKELATLYLGIFVMLIFSGPGNMSLDHVLFNKRKRR